MFSIAFLLRVAIAPHFGFHGDLQLFQKWSMELRAVGTYAFYATDPLVDYPPGYLYLLWAIGKLSASPGYLLLKVPAIVSDLVLAWISACLLLGSLLLLSRLPEPRRAPLEAATR